MSDYIVRPIREADIEAIIAIDGEVTGRRGPDRAGFWRGLLTLQLPPEETDGPVQAAPAEAQTHPLCLVGQTGEGASPTIAGFIIGDVQSWQFGLPRHGRIVTIGVLPAHRRAGLATQLSESLLKVFEHMGLPFVHCLVIPGDPLSGFFGSLGFQPPGFTILERKLGRGATVPR